jgi:hypothetical protein
LTDRSSSRPPPAAIEPRRLPQRSPQLSSANAPVGGLKPPPQGGSEGPNNLHHSYSTAGSRTTICYSVRPPAFAFTPAGAPGRDDGPQGVRRALCAVGGRPPPGGLEQTRVGPVRPRVGNRAGRRRATTPSRACSPSSAIVKRSHTVGMVESAPRPGAKDAPPERSLVGDVLLVCDQRGVREIVLAEVLG